MPSKFEVGQRVRVYGHNEGEVFAGEVCDGIDPAGKGRIAVCRDGTRDDSTLLYLCHPKQCRRLKPREKSVRVTSKMLAKAWDHMLDEEFSDGEDRAMESSQHSVPLKVLAKALGLDEARP